MRSQRRVRGGGGWVRGPGVRGRGGGGWEGEGVGGGKVVGWERVETMVFGGVGWGWRGGGWGMRWGWNGVEWSG